MSPLKSAAAGMILQKLVELHAERRHPPGQKALRVAGAVLGLTAAVLLLIAGYRWLGTRFDAIETPAIAAGTLLFIGCVALGVASQMAPRRNDAVADMEQKFMQAAKDLFADTGEDLQKSVKDHPRAALSVAALMGFLLARKIF